MAPLVQQRGVHANLEIVDAKNPRCPAFEVRERAERARDRAFYVAEQRLGELLSPARPHGGPAVAVARRSRGRGVGVVGSTTSIASPAKSTKTLHFLVDVRPTWLCRIVGRNRLDVRIIGVFIARRVPEAVDVQDFNV